MQYCFTTWPAMKTLRLETPISELKSPLSEGGAESDMALCQHADPLLNLFLHAALNYCMRFVPRSFF